MEKSHLQTILPKQENILVECVPSAAVTAVGGGGVAEGGVPARGSTYWGDVPAWGGGCIPACTEADTLPPVNRMTDRQV